jgi:hypothetical protein
MTTGMSAPPIGSTAVMPSAAAARSSTIINSSELPPTAIATPQPSATRSSTAFNGFCRVPRVIGRPEMSS